VARENAREEKERTLSLFECMSVCNLCLSVHLCLSDEFTSESAMDRLTGRQVDNMGRQVCYRSLSSGRPGLMAGAACSVDGACGCPFGD
jgi:hypothetical protein